MIRFQRLRLLGFASLLITLSAAANAQATWYVDVNAVPPGNGSQAQPYTSIQYAIDQTTTHLGDTLFVAPGDYAAFTAQSKYLRIHGAQGASQTRINGSVLITNGVDLEGFTLNPGGDVFATDVRRCVILGTGLRLSDGNEVSHCVFFGCSHAIDDWGFSGGGYWINHCIFWNCSLAVSTNASGLLEYCAGQSSPLGFGWLVSHNVSGDPMLWEPASGDMHLRPGSPCIDAGDPSAPPDPDGSRADIGLIPYDGTYAPGPANYCAGKLNSQGCTPSIGAVGSASASSGNPFLVTGSNVVPGKPALLLLGMGKSSLPFQGGVLCIAQPIKRLGQQVSGGSNPCTGTLGFDMQAYVQGGANPALVPGALADVQWWGRDQLDPAGFGSSLSDGLHFGIAP
jgi:hypothetical protein